MYRSDLLHPAEILDIVYMAIESIASGGNHKGVNEYSFCQYKIHALLLLILLHHFFSCKNRIELKAQFFDRFPSTFLPVY